MNVQSVSSSQINFGGTSVRDVIIAKAIQNGYNPYCKSTDARAKMVTDEMRARVRSIRVPESKAVVTAKSKAPVREVTEVRTKNDTHGRREIVHIENFELVSRKTRPFSLGTLVSVMITAMVLAMVVFSSSLINEEARRYSELEQTLSVLKEEDRALTLALEAKHGAVDVDDFATNELGMVAARAANSEYLSLSAGDTVSVYSNDSDDSSVAMELLNTFSDKIGGFLEYLD